MSNGCATVGSITELLKKKKGTKKKKIQIKTAKLDTRIYFVVRSRKFSKPIRLNFEDVYKKNMRKETEPKPSENNRSCYKGREWKP